MKNSSRPIFPRTMFAIKNIVTAVFLWVFAQLMIFYMDVFVTGQASSWLLGTMGPTSCNGVPCNTHGNQWVMFMMVVVCGYVLFKVGIRMWDTLVQAPLIIGLKRVWHHYYPEDCKNCNCSVQPGELCTNDCVCVKEEVETDGQ